MPSTSVAVAVGTRNGGSWISVPIAWPAPCRACPTSLAASTIPRCAASTARASTPGRVSATAAACASCTTAYASRAQSLGSPTVPQRVRSPQ